MDLQSNPVNEILYITFNQDYTCFVCGTESGFRVYGTDPFKLTHRRDFENGGGLGVVAMLFRTNIIAFAGGGANPRFQPHKVMIWDDRTERVVAELSFRSVVKAVRLRRELVVVVLEKKVYVYGFRSLRLLNSIETISNPKGLCCLSVGAERVTLVCPGMQQGRALVIFYPKGFGESKAPTDRERTTIIAAHESPIAMMGTDYSGSLLATASDKGTIVRIFDASGGARLQELRRGMDQAQIHSLAFGPSGDWLAVASDKGTVHIFAVTGNRGRDSATTVGSGGSGGSLGRAPSMLSASGGAGGGALDGSYSANSKSNFQRIAKVLPAYFSSEWSCAQFRVPDYRCIAAFGSDPHTIVVVCANGSYYKARFDPEHGGQMTREEYGQFDDASQGGTAAAAAAAEAETRVQSPDGGGGAGDGDSPLIVGGDGGRAVGTGGYPVVEDDVHVVTVAEAAEATETEATET